MQKADAQINDAIRKKVTEKGIHSLYDEELISLILKSGDEVKDVLTLAKNLLRRYRTLGEMALLPQAQIARENRGMTESKALSLKIAFELGRRAQKSSCALTVVHGAEDVFELLREDMRFLRQECFKAILLNTKYMVLSIEDISIGTINASLVHAREVFRAAIAQSAYAVILVHNHPSTNPTPSRSDIEITEKLKNAGEIVGIKVLDHVILGGDTYYSFEENQ